jgi:menaquinone-dependent protoporphyrinogen oxidase
MTMNDNVLLAYATRYGSTKEVAETIAATLREDGLTVELQPIQEVRSLEGYSAVVLGAPLYMGRWNKDADRFLSRYREALMQRPVAIFALGPVSTDEKEWQGARTLFDTEMAKYPWLTPIALEMFGGKYDPSKLRLPDNLIAKLPASPLHNAPASDARDWTAIRTWANNLATKLKPVLSP